MATILPSPVGGQKQRLHTIRIDMTPMVDLGFLLITFFIFTAALTQPTVTRLIMPKQGHETIEVSSETLLSVIVDKNKVMVYEGALPDALKADKVHTTNFDVKTGLGNFVRLKQKALESIGKRDELMVAIKPLNSSSYQSVISTLDEMLINKVRRYAIVPLSADDKTLAE